MICPQYHRSHGGPGKHAYVFTAPSQYSVRSKKDQQTQTDSYSDESYRTTLQNRSLKHSTLRKSEGHRSSRSKLSRKSTDQDAKTDDDKTSSSTSRSAEYRKNTREQSSSSFTSSNMRLGHHRGQPAGGTKLKLLCQLPALLQKAKETKT